MKFELYDQVRFKQTSDPKLDNSRGTVIGFYCDNSTIVLFVDRPENYNPAIVAVNSILEKINAD